MNFQPNILTEPVPFGQRTVTLLPAQQQSVWGGRAVLNFAFGSAGAALYLISVWFQLFAEKTITIFSLNEMRVIAAACVWFGLLAVATETRRPGRSRYLLANLRSSWMSRESLAAILFVPLAVLTAWFNTPVLIGFAAGAAAVFIISQALLIYNGGAVAAWARPSLPVAFVTSSFAAGTGLTLVLSASAFGKVALLAALLCSAVDLLFWLIYLFPGPTDRDLGAATALLCKPKALLSTIVIGRLIPILILLLALRAPAGAPQWTLIVAGLALFIGSWSQRDGIIRRCGYLRPLTLNFGSAKTRDRSV